MHFASSVFMKAFRNTNDRALDHQDREPAGGNRKDRPEAAQTMLSKVKGSFLGIDTRSELKRGTRRHGANNS